jgi:hypothetical protein
MDYRDERDAMRGRIENLEQDLASANRELEERRRQQDPQRLAELERELAEARQKLDQVGGELERVKGKRPPNRAPIVIVTVAASVMLLGVVMGVFVFVRAAPPPPPPVVSQPVQTQPDPPQEAQKPAPKPAPPAPAAPKRRASATWKASVTRATGLALAPGAACTLEATLEGGDHGVSAKDLTVTCGGKALYRSTDALEGMSMYSSGANELAGPSAGTYVYELAYHDKGTRTGARNEVSLDTSAKTGAVWRDSAPSWRVELAITPKSAAVQGDPLSR